MRLPHLKKTVFQHLYMQYKTAMSKPVTHLSTHHAHMPARAARLLVLAAALCAALSCSRPAWRHGDTAQDTAQDTAASAVTGPAYAALLADTAYTPVVLLPCTPVKQQGASPLCWLYAMLATIETEHAAQGDSINLSADYTARQYADSLARCYYFTRDARQMSLRGTAPMGYALLRQLGAMPYDSYHAAAGAPVPWRATARRLMLAARTCGTLAAYRAAAARIMDNSAGHLPPHIYMLGAQYTPLDFAQSVCRPGEWVPVASFAHRPYGTWTTPELADNRLGQACLNLPPRDMVALMERSLAARHPVCWEGGLGRGFDTARGVADIPAAAACTPQARQRMWERRETTDDHCMALVGMVRRKADGRLFFVAKNSWGDTGRYRGLMLLSDRYVMMKTVIAVVNVQALGAGRQEK